LPLKNTLISISFYRVPAVNLGASTLVPAVWVRLLGLERLIQMLMYCWNFKFYLLNARNINICSKCQGLNRRLDAQNVLKEEGRPVKTTRIANQEKEKSVGAYRGWGIKCPPPFRILHWARTKRCYSGPGCQFLPDCPFGIHYFTNERLKFHLLKVKKKKIPLPLKDVLNVFNDRFFIFEMYSVWSKI